MTNVQTKTMLTSKRTTSINKQQSPNSKAFNHTMKPFSILSLITVLQVALASELDMSAWPLDSNELGRLSGSQQQQLEAQQQLNNLIYNFPAVDLPGSDQRQAQQHAPTAPAPTSNNSDNQEPPTSGIINGNQATYVEPPLDFKPIIYNERAVLTLISQQADLQQPTRFRSRYAATRVPSSDAMKAAPSGRWTDWRDLGFDPELAADGDLSEPKYAVRSEPPPHRYETGPGSHYGLVPGRAPFKVRPAPPATNEQKLAPKTMASQDDSLAEQAERLVLGAALAARQFTADAGDLVRSGPSSAISRPSSEDQQRQQQLNGINRRKQVVRSTNEDEQDPMLVMASETHSSRARPSASIGMKADEQRPHRGQPSAASQAQPTAATLCNKFRSVTSPSGAGESGEMAANNQINSRETKNGSSHATNKQRRIRKIRRRRKPEQQQQQQHKHRLIKTEMSASPIGAAQANQVNGLNRSNQQINLPIDRQQAQKATTLKRSASEIGGQQAVASAAAAARRNHELASRRRKLQRTQLPVGLSSWMLGGIRDLDARHWQMPADIMQKLAINDIDFAPNSAYAQPAAKFESPSQTVLIVEREQSSQKPAQTQQQPTRTDSAHNPNAIPR